MKRIIIKLVFALFIIILLVSINTRIYAAGNPITAGEDFIREGKENKKEIDLAPASNIIYNTLLSIGVVVAVVVATILGLQFMLGGIEAQVKVKEMLVPFIIGCIVVFGGFGIWKLALAIGDRFEQASTIQNNPVVAYVDDSKGGIL